MTAAVKICGVCRPEDAALAAAAGALYVGVILAPGRKRTRTLDEAAGILAAAGAARRVGVFVDAAPAEVLTAARRLGLDAVQLHGDEPPEVAAAVRAGGCEVWKAVRPRTRDDFLAGVRTYEEVVDALLIDGWSPLDVGGTGTRFPWSEVAAARRALAGGTRLVAAGGLGPDNVAEAIATLDPDIVDVSSGVERTPGVKDAGRVRSFLSAVRAAGSVTRPAGAMPHSREESS